MSESKKERLYNAFGWAKPEREGSHIFGPVTVEEARTEAEARDLRAYHLGPVDYEERGAHTISYVRDESGRFVKVPMWRFLEECYNFAEIYPPKERIPEEGV